MNDGRIILWNTHEVDPIVSAVLPHVYSDTSARHATFSPDGSIIAASSGLNVVLWDVARKAEVATLPGAGGQPVFSPDGRRLATATRTNIQVWDVESRSVKVTLPDDATGLPVFSPDGRILATTSADGVILWDSDQQSVLATLEAGDVRGIAFSPDGRILATGSVGYTDIVLWDVAQGAQLNSFSSRSGDPVASLSFSPDGSQLAWGALESANTAIGGDYTIMLWDVAENTMRSSYTVHTALPRTVAFSPDGKFLVWDGQDVLLWSVDSGNPVTLLKDPKGRASVFLYNPIFSSDGRLLATDRSDGGIVIWDVGIDAWVRRACMIAGKGLTQEE